MDARFVKGSDQYNLPLLMELVALHIDNETYVEELFIAANAHPTNEARDKYLLAKNYMGVNVRLSFINFMTERGIMFDVEEAVVATRQIMSLHKPQFGRGVLSVVKLT